MINEFHIDPPIYLDYIGEFGSKVSELPIHKNVALHQYVDDNGTIVISREAASSTLKNKNVCLHIYGHVNEIAIPRFTISVQPIDNISTLVKTVEVNIIPKYNLPAAIQLRLRKSQNNVPGNSLYSDRTVESCGLRDGDTLVVEQGLSATSSHMVLYYKVPDETVHSIVCKCTQTVARCLELMIDNCSSLVKGEGHYIMTLDWSGDPSDVVYDTEQSLAKARISHGDTVAIRKGAPPPKNAILVHIQWLKAGEEPIRPSYEQWLTNAMSNLSLGSDQLSVDGPKYESWSVNVSRETSIEELKVQLLSAFTGTMPESIHFMRLRAFNHNKPGMIYKTPGKTLRSYKISGPSTSMLMELLPAAEHLRYNTSVIYRYM